MSDAADLSLADSQLRFSAILPDFQDWLERMAADSAPVADTLGLVRHVYGNQPRQWVEMAAGSGSARMVPVFIHGGYWRSLDAENHRFVLPALAQMGVGVANLEYRLMPDARMADLVADALAGLNKIAQHFPQTRLLPIGHSAGAHLAHAAIAADSDGDLAERIACLVSISGAFDLSLIAASFLQDELQLTTDEISQFAIAQAPAVPSLFVAGSMETEPFRHQAKALAETYGLANALEIVGAHHMNILHGGLTGSAPLVSVLNDWLAGRRIHDVLECSLHDLCL